MKFPKELKTTSFLSETIEIVGDLYLKGGIRIDGKVFGKIDGESTVYFGDSAQVKAEISADSVISSGSITGMIVAEKLVKINNPGSVEGEISTSNLGIESGVYFNGKCRISSPEKNKTQKIITEQPRKAIAQRD